MCLHIAVGQNRMGLLRPGNRQEPCHNSPWRKVFIQSASFSTVVLHFEMSDFESFPEVLLLLCIQQCQLTYNYAKPSNRLISFLFIKRILSIMTFVFPLKGILSLSHTHTCHFLYFLTIYILDWVRSVDLGGDMHLKSLSICNCWYTRQDEYHKRKLIVQFNANSPSCGNGNSALVSYPPVTLQSQNYI